MSEAIAECCAETIVEDCWPALWQHSRVLCCLVTAAAVLVAVAVGLAVAFATAHPIAATVEAASLSRLAAADNNNSNNNYYALSLTVALRNRNVAMRAALGGGIIVAGGHFGGAAAFRIAEAGQEIGAKEKAEYKVEAAGEVTPEDGLLPAGKNVVQVELGLHGEVSYRPFHRGRHEMGALCTLQLLPLPPPPGFSVVAPVFQRVKCVPVKTAF
ncbi:unnamed protein product [Urochloa humidicola]